MKRAFIQAAIIVAVGILLTPLFMWLAYMERGYWAVGGEFAPIFLFILAAVFVIDRRKKQIYAEEEGELCERTEQNEQTDV